MTEVTIADIEKTDEAALARMSRKELEDFVRQTLELTQRLAEQLGESSAIGLLPPFSGDRRRSGRKMGDCDAPADKSKAGKRPGG